MTDKTEKNATSKKIPNYVNYILGGSSGCFATCFVHPMDLVKTRMQVDRGMYKNAIDCIKTVISQEGFLALYKGLSAGIFRQATYTTSRLGVYLYMMEKYKAQYNQSPTIIASAFMGLTAGAFGAFIGTPAEVGLIRMMADGRLPLNERRNYTNVFNAIGRIVKEEGVTTLWRGAMPTVGRAMVVNMSQLASYTQFKNYFIQELHMKDGILVHLNTSMLSGLLTTITSMPLDMAKTKIQNMKTVNGKPEYKNMLDVLVQVARKNGITALWRGFMPYFLRVGPHTLLTLVSLEKSMGLYNKYVLGVQRSSGM